MSAHAGAAQASHTPVARRGDLSWQDGAPCESSDPEQFFPGRGPGSSDAAKRVCLGCPVKDVCLEYALTHGERWGVWGGLSEVERRQLKRSLRAGAT